MRFNVLFTALVLCLGLLAGCASSPNWRGMTEQQIMDWKDMQVGAEEAQAYRAAGLDADAVQAWRDVGLAAQDDILAWRQSGWTPEAAAPWLDQQFDLDTAVAWYKEKFSADEAREWIDAGFTLLQAKENRGKGLTPIQ